MRKGNTGGNTDIIVVVVTSLAETTVGTTLPHPVSILVAIIKPGKVCNYAALKWIQLIKRNNSVIVYVNLTHFLLQLFPLTRFTCPQIDN